MKKVLLFTFLLSATLLLMALPLCAQQTSSRTDRETRDYHVKVDVDLVNVTATVTKGEGEFVRDLKGEDFSVYEDGVLQKITHFRRDQDVPISAGILLDISSSMRDKLPDAKRAVIHFTRLIQPGDEVFLIAFNDEPFLVQDFTADRKAFQQAVEGLEAGGYTALYDTLLLGFHRVQGGRHEKKVLLLITDGKDTDSSTSYGSVLKTAQQSQVLVYAIGITSQALRPREGSGAGNGSVRSGQVRLHLDELLGRLGTGTRKEGILSSLQRSAERQPLILDVDMRVLKSFAGVSGGLSCLVEYSTEGNEIDQVCVKIAEELRMQYSLGYTPPRRAGDGSWRKIRVETADPQYRVRAREGYYSSERYNTSPD